MTPTALAGTALAVLLVGVVAPEPALTFAPTRSPASVLTASHPPGPPPTTASPSTSAGVPADAGVHRVLVVGDSVALTIGRGIERWGEKHGAYVWNGGALGCTLVDGVPVRGYWGVDTRKPDSCRIHETFPDAIKRFDPDVVVALYGAWDVYDASFDKGHTWSAPGSAAFDRHYAAAVSNAVRRLSSGGAHVLWLAPPCYEAHPGASDRGAVWYDPARVEALGTVVRGLAPTLGFTVSDVVHDEGCPVDLGARPDGTHYTDAGADAVAALLGPEIQRLGGQVNR